MARIQFFTRKYDKLTGSDTTDIFVAKKAANISFKQTDQIINFQKNDIIDLPGKWASIVGKNIFSYKGYGSIQPYLELVPVGSAAIAKFNVPGDGYGSYRSLIWRTPDDKIASILLPGYDSGPVTLI